MARAIIVRRISRRTGAIGIPRSLRDETVRRLEPFEKPSLIGQRVLTAVINKTGRDGNDRQIDYVTVTKTAKGPRRIKSRVLYRVYKSESDNKVHAYKGPAHQGNREGVEARKVRVR